jgi:type II secretory pathway component HofQ
MSYTLGEAAKASGKSKATIHRNIQSGKISATKDEATGSWMIEPAELHRVYPAVSLEQHQNRELRQSETATETLLKAQLEQEREERRRERVQLEGTIDDLRRRLDAEGEERRKLTALLTDQRAKAPEVMVTPPPTSEAMITPPPAAADPAPAAISASVPVTPARPNPAPVAVKVRPVKTPPAKEAGWFRRMMGGR